jgi:superoxide oxidase
MPPIAPRYPTALIALHWAMLILLAAVYAAIELREFFPKGSDIREGFKAWHFTLGLTILVLVVVRVVLRLRTATPPITPAPSLWQKVAARGVHLALYGLMIAMPLAGWTILSAKGATIPFWGTALPPLVSPNKPLAAWLQDIHATAGTVGYWLIGLHAAAGLAHHYFWKDDTLRRMLPWRQRAR